MPLLKERTLFITVARIDEKLKVNVIPTKAKEGEDEALTTPLSYTGSPEELDAELGKHLSSYVDSHIALSSTLAEAKAEMDAAAKLARQRVKATQQATKTDPATKNEQTAAPTPAAAETTIFSVRRRRLQNQWGRRWEKKGEKLHHDRSKSAVSQLYLQRCKTSGPGSEDDTGRSENHLQPSISRAGNRGRCRARNCGGASAVQLRQGDWDERVARP